MFPQPFHHSLEIHNYYIEWALKVLVILTPACGNKVFIVPPHIRGIAPLPKEAASSVATAKDLSRIVEY